MTPTDLYDGTYSRFSEQVLAAVRAAASGEDIGQNSWLTVDELDRFLAWLELSPAHRVLEVASGSGGPALHLAERAGCDVTGIDVNEHGIATATRSALDRGLSDRVRFARTDATARLEFPDDAFDALVCIDAMNHFPDRLSVLREWRRVLRPGRQAVFTDPVVISGPVTGDELARRSSIGPFLFVPLGVNEQLIAQAGLQLVQTEDVTANAELVSGRWHRARQAHEAELLRIEGAERFEGLQRFLHAVERLSSERRLSRIAYLVLKP